MRSRERPPTVAIVGGGPAGLMAASVLVRDGVQVSVYDRMPTVGRKFLLAGRGGLNLTHGEPLDRFLTRYADRAEALAPHIHAFPPAAVRAWAAALGVETFVGSSGRVFPADMKAARLLRAWVHELRDAGVRFRARHRFVGFDGEGPSVVFDHMGETVRVTADAIILGLGGASYARMGSDGRWVGVLEDAGVSVRPLVASNVGFLADWSTGFAERAAGRPLKNVAVSCEGQRVLGEVMLTEYGVEGQAIYAMTRVLRESIERTGHAVIRLDIKPDVDEASLVRRLEKPRGKASFATHLKRTVNLSRPLPTLLREVAPSEETLRSPASLAALLKALPIKLVGMRPIDEAISSAGGVDFAAVDASLMLRARPGVFVAGEMLDFEAPTGGYLLQGAMSTGYGAGVGAQRWVRRV